MLLVPRETRLVFDNRPQFTRLPFGPRSELSWHRLKNVMGGGVTKPSPQPFATPEDRAGLRRVAQMYSLGALMQVLITIIELSALRLRLRAMLASRCDTIQSS